MNENLDEAARLLIVVEDRATRLERDLKVTQDLLDAEIARLVPLAQELARKVGAAGITVSDIRIVAVQRGILTGQETGRQLSYLSAVPVAAGLERTGEYRRSVIVRTHGNLGAVWRLREGSTSRDSVAGAA